MKDLNWNRSLIWMFICGCVVKITKGNLCNNLVVFKKHYILTESEKDTLEQLAATCGVISIGILSKELCFKACSQDGGCAAFSYSPTSCKICLSQIVGATSFDVTDTSLMINSNQLDLLINGETTQTTGPCGAHNDEGPHGRDCLVQLWLEAGCYLDGSSCPGRIAVGTEWWDARSVSAVRADMGGYYTYAMQGNRRYKQYCFGIANDIAFVSDDVLNLYADGAMITSHQGTTAAGSTNVPENAQLIALEINNTDRNSWKFYEDSDCYGNDFGSLSIGTLEDCLLHCQMTEGCVGIVFALLNGVAICWPKSSCNHFTYLQGFITVSLSSVDASWNNFAFDDDSWSTAYEVDNFWPTDVRDVHTVDAPWVWCGSSNNVEGTAYFRYKVFPQDCTEVYARGYITSGVYRIDPDGGGTIEVYCDLSESPTDGSTTGGWLVFQRRKDNSKDFYRGWSDYVQGFGDLDGNVWLGLDNLARILNSGSYELHVFLEAFELNDTAYAKYTTFHITDASVNYRLTIGGYSGTAGDCMAYHNGMEFSTHDADHDAHTSRNCGQYFRGAFWYRTCHCANLNGQYLGGVHTSYADGIEWASYKGHYYSLKTSVMKIRKL